MIVACCLWLYVMNEQNPIIERSFVVNLETQGLQSGMMVFNAPAKVSVKVRSTRSILGDLSPDMIKAYVNLKNLKVGQHTVTVACSFPRGEVVEINPKVVNLYVDVTKEKTFPVSTKVIGTSNSDLTVGRRAVNPGEVKVKGAAHRVDAIDKIYAPLDITEHKEDFVSQVALVAVDADGVEMPDLVLEPAEVSVDAKIVHQLTTGKLEVQANFTGSLPPTLKLGKVEIVPAQIQVTAAPSVLEKMTSLATEPIDLGKNGNNGTIEVPLQIPSGVRSEVRSVSVRISVENK